MKVMTAHVLEARGRWAEGSCEPERFVVVGDRIIVSIYVHVRLKDETEWREGRVADVYTSRDGKATHFRTFVDRQEAFEWVGVKASELIS